MVNQDTLFEDPKDELSSLTIEIKSQLPQIGKEVTNFHKLLQEGNMPVNSGKNWKEKLKLGSRSSEQRKAHLETIFNSFHSFLNEMTKQFTLALAIRTQVMKLVQIKD